MKNINIRKNSEGQVWEVNNGKNKVEIFQISGRGKFETNSIDRAIYGINWVALGTVSIIEAEEYIALMKRAIEEVKKMNA